VHYRQDGTDAYQLTDHLGNIRAVIMKNGENAVSLTAKTDYYPFGMPMPNRNIEGDYRYKYQGQEKDPETGMEAFELRLWDSRIGRWLTTDPYREFKSPYIGMGNMPIVAIDPDGGDIIILGDSEAVLGGLGHSAVLIGNDIDGWRYFSKNGTEGFSKPYGKNYKPDLGNIPFDSTKGSDEHKGNNFIGTGLTANQVVNIVNKTNPAHHHNYDKYVRIKTTKEEDEKAILAATTEANSDKYGIFGTSCIDVPQEALKGTGIDFKYKGYNNILPNEWFKEFTWHNNNGRFFGTRKPKVTITTGPLTQGEIEY